mgnify:CR=1 FL=1
MPNTFTKSQPRFVYDFVSANFYNSTTSGSFFVPLNGYILEQADPGTNTGEYFAIIAPYDGILVKVMIRSEQLLRHDTTVALFTADTNTEIPATDVGSITAVFSVLNLSDDTAYPYDFTGNLNSGVNTFSKNQVLAIRVTTSGSALYDAYCMCVFRYDITT